MGGYSIDITERKQAEEALLQSERRLLEAQALAQVGNWELNLADRMLWASEETFRIYGIERGSPWMPLALAQEHVHPDDRPFMDQALRRLLQQRQAYDMEFRLIRGTDSAVRVIHSWAHLVLDAAGAPLKVLGVVQDITARKQAEDAVRQLNAELEQRVEARTAELSARTVELSEANRQLVQALRIKDEFLVAMSHELRTPLAAILGLAELLQMQSYGPLNEKQAYYAQTIYQSGQHLLALINDVLDLTKLAAGHLPLELGPVDLSETCQAALQLTKPQADKKQLAVSLVLDQAVTRLQADARRLKQILVNLLANAVKFTPEGGRVGLAVSGDDKQGVVEFTVWDTGIGIAAEDLPRLFQDFVQLDARLARNYEGTGLGLALVKRLAELHSGRVKAESDGLGKGSRFTVSLPWDL